MLSVSSFSRTCTLLELDCKTVRIFAYSSKREQSNKRSGTRLKTESETGERRYGRVRLARFARVRLVRHALPISLLILRKKLTVSQSTEETERVPMWFSVGFYFERKRTNRSITLSNVWKINRRTSIENKVIIFTSTCCSVSCVSRVTRAIKGPHGIVTISIDIAIIGVVCTLVKIWEKKYNKCWRETFQHDECFKISAISVSPMQDAPDT